MKNFTSYIFFTVFGLFLMKMSGQPIEFGIKEGAFFFNINMKMLMALLFYAVSFLLWTGIVVKNDLSFIVPFSSAIVNLLSVLIGVLIFQEQLNAYKAIGIAMAIIGVILMNYK